MAVPNLWRLRQFDQKRNGVGGRLEDGPLMKQITVEAMPCVITYVGIVRRNGAQQPRNIGYSAIGMAQLVPSHLVEPFEHGFAPVGQHHSMSIAGTAILRKAFFPRSVSIFSGGAWNIHAHARRRGGSERPKARLIGPHELDILQGPPRPRVKRHSVG